MNTLPLYTYHRMWKDGQGRPYSEAFHSREPASARRSHSEAKTFRWGLAGQSERSVTDLSAFDGARSAVVAEGVNERDVERHEQYFQR